MPVNTDWPSAVARKVGWVSLNFGRAVECGGFKSATRLPAALAARGLFFVTRPSVFLSCGVSLAIFTLGFCLSAVATNNSNFFG